MAPNSDRSTACLKIPKPAVVHSARGAWWNDRQRTAIPQACPDKMMQSIVGCRIRTGCYLQSEQPGGSGQGLLSRRLLEPITHGGQLGHDLIGRVERGAKREPSAEGGREA